MLFLYLQKHLMYPATSFKYNVDDCLTRIDTDDLRKISDPQNFILLYVSLIKAVIQQ